MKEDSQSGVYSQLQQGYGGLEQGIWMTMEPSRLTQIILEVIQQI